MAPVDGRNITNWSPITQTRLRHMRRSFCRDVAQPWGQRKVTVKSPCQVQISSAFFSACMWGTMEHHHTTAAKLPDGWIHSNLITVFKPLLDCYCLNGLEPQNRTKCAVHVSLSLQTFFFLKGFSADWWCVSMDLHSTHHTYCTAKKTAHAMCVHLYIRMEHACSCRVQCFGEFLLIIVCFRSEGPRLRSGLGFWKRLSPECLNRVADRWRRVGDRVLLVLS